VGFADVLADDHRIDNEARQYLEMISSSAMRLASLATDTLALSRLEQNETGAVAGRCRSGRLSPRRRPRIQRDASDRLTRVGRYAGGERRRVAAASSDRKPDRPTRSNTRPAASRSKSRCAPVRAGSNSPYAIAASASRTPSARSSSDVSPVLAMRVPSASAGPVSDST